MSLLDEAMEPCIIMDKTTHDDGYGGIITTYTEGAGFSAAIAFDSSLAARTASVQGVTDLYTITTRKNIVLQAGDVIKRESDGKILQITSDGNDNSTPDSASLDMRVVSAKEFKKKGSKNG